MFIGKRKNNTHETLHILKVKAHFEKEPHFGNESSFWNPFWKWKHDFSAFLATPKNSYDSVDIAEEPAAEPINTHGDGWVPISINQVIKTISEEIDSKVELTTPKGQLISKCLFGVIVSTEMATKIL